MLSQEQLVWLRTQLKLNPEACTVCHKFFGDNCEECQYKGKTVKEIFIQEFTPMVKSLAAKFSQKSLHKTYHELESDGFFALQRAIERPGEIKNLHAFIYTWIINSLRKAILESDVIRIPSEVKGEKRDRVKVQLYANLDFLPIWGEQCLVDLYETLNSVVSTDVEKIILKCLIEGGYTVEDISGMCKLSKGRVSQIKGQLLERVWRVTNDL